MGKEPVPPSSSEENETEIFESEGYEKTENPEYVIKWDGSDTEVVADENEVTGLKFKYILEEAEILRFLKKSENFTQNKKLQIKHTILQGILFVFLIALVIFAKSSYHFFWSIVPIVAIALIWILPEISIKKIAKKLYTGKEISIEIFPESIEVTVDGKEKEIPLDGTFDSEKCEGIIVIFSKTAKISVMIPLRAIEPEFLADVEATIFAGVNPRYKD